MKIILTTFADSVAITRPSAWCMKALTNGGLGRLPGDADTSDITDMGMRIEVATSMPSERAIENSIRTGLSAEFAEQWYGALLSGGETDATALDLIRQKSCRSGGDQTAIDPEDVPADRFFRDAWRGIGGSITIDLPEARRILACRCVRARSQAQAAIAERIDVKGMIGEDITDDEALYESLAAINLKALGSQMLAAQSPEALKAIWPEALGR